MARNNEGHLELPEMDQIQPKNIPHNESLPLGQKLLLHHGSDAPLRIGHSSHGNMGLRINDLPSSSRTVQTLGYRVGNPGTSHAPFVHFHAGSSSSHLPDPAVNYPHRSEEGFAPAGSHVDNIRASMKRKGPSVHPAGISATGYYVGSSSNTQPSNSVQPNATPLAEPFLRQIPLSIDQSGWDVQHLIHQEGFQRNVRARHSHSIPSVPRSASTYPLNSVHVPTASASSSAPVEMNQVPVSLPIRTLPSGAPGMTSRVQTGRAYYPVVGSSSSSSVGAVPTIQGSSGAAMFANGGYAPSSVHAGTVPIFPNPAPATSSGSRAMLHQMVIQSHPAATSAATSSTSMRTVQPSLPARTAAASRHARHVSAGLANNGRYRRARSSYYRLHPLMVEAERFMMDHLVFYESRAAAADPHRDMRLDIDNMSYEDLLALGEAMGNVNTGLADEKVSECVKEVVCCSSDHTQMDQDDGSCAICLEDYRDKDALGILKCRHDFHAGCIKKWLQTKNSCPVCKAAAA